MSFTHGGTHKTQKYEWALYHEKIENTKMNCTLKVRPLLHLSSFWVGHAIQKLAYI
jgi:hypothetical protein